MALHSSNQCTLCSTVLRVASIYIISIQPYSAGMVVVAGSIGDVQHVLGESTSMPGQLHFYINWSDKHNTSLRSRSAITTVAKWMLYLVGEGCE
jgi:hypothetical protein